MGRPIPWATIGVSTLALGAFVAALRAAAKGPKGRAARLTPTMLAAAAKWAKQRGLPLEWVIATILAESDGNPYAQGDCYASDGTKLPECRSVGLMQVNWSVHGPALQKAGIAANREALFNPATNIEAGTLYLRDAYTRVQAALAVRGSDVPTDMLVRYAYTGPALAVSAIKQGVDPKNVYKDSANLVARWNRAVAQAATYT